MKAYDWHVILSSWKYFQDDNNNHTEDEERRRRRDEENRERFRQSSFMEQRKEKECRELLGVKSDAGKREIESAFRLKSRYSHPGKLP